MRRGSRSPPQGPDRTGPTTQGLYVDPKGDAALEQARKNLRELSDEVMGEGKGHAKG